MDHYNGILNLIFGVIAPFFLSFAPANIEIILVLKYKLNIISALVASLVVYIPVGIISFLLCLNGSGFGRPEGARCATGEVAYFILISSAGLITLFVITFLLFIITIIKKGE